MAAHSLKVKSQILLIGGTGVLSRAIATSMVSAGHQVTILTDGKGALEEPKGICQHLIVDRDNEEEFRIVLGELKELIWDLVIDCICYSAGQAQSLMSVIPASNCGHIIAISTYLVYEESQALLAEDSAILSGSKVREYELGKIEMERAYLDSSHAVTVLRLPHVLGEGSQLGILPMHNRDCWLIKRLRDAKPIFLADGGKQLFQAVFNEDIAKIILEIGGNVETYKKVYNCANPKVFTALEYYQWIADFLTVTMEVKNVPSGIIQDSKWGWDSVMGPKIMDISEIGSVVGPNVWTDTEGAIKVTLDSLLNDDPGIDESYTCMDELEKLTATTNIADSDLSSREEYCRVIMECTLKRKRQPSDEKMSD